MSGFFAGLFAARLLRFDASGMVVLAFLVSSTLAPASAFRQVVTMETQINASSAVETGDRCPGRLACKACVEESAAGCSWDVMKKRCCKVMDKGLFHRHKRCGHTLLATDNSECIDRDYRLDELALERLGESKARDFDICHEAIKASEREILRGKPMNLEKLPACVSSLLRNAILAELDSGTEEEELPEIVEQRCNLSSHDDRWVSPTCCQLAVSTTTSPTIKNECGVLMPALKDHERDLTALPPSRSFRPVRRAWEGMEDKLVKSVKAGPLRPKKFRQGKSGSSFFTTYDKKFVFKSIRSGGSNRGQQSEDRYLIKMMDGEKQRTVLVEYLRARQSKTLLNQILGMYTVNFLNYAETFVLMEDATMEMHQAGTSDCKMRQYDLKGVSRPWLPDSEADESKEERQNVDFRVFENNKFRLTQNDCARLFEMVQADTAFLDEHHQIDYSILAKFGKGAGCSVPGCHVAGGEMRANCFETTDGEILTISIIDYLNKFRGVKTLELSPSMNFSTWRKFMDYGKKINEFVWSTCDAGFVV